MQRFGLNDCLPFACQIIKMRGGVPSMPILGKSLTLDEIYKQLNSEDNLFVVPFYARGNPLSKSQIIKAFSSPPMSLLIGLDYPKDPVKGHVVACTWDTHYKEYYVQDMWHDGLPNTFAITGYLLDNETFKQKYKGYIVDAIFQIDEPRKGRSFAKK